MTYSITLTFADGTTTTISGFSSNAAAESHLYDLMTNKPWDPSIQTQITSP